MTPKGFSRVLLTHGCDVEVIDALPEKDPVLSHAEDRTGKLLAWVQDNKPTHYVVLDDLDLKVPNLIRPRPGVGLEPRHISEATEILNGR